MIVRRRDLDALLAAGRRAAAQTALDQLIQQLDPAVPIAFLPLRLETRFKTSPAGTRSLFIRIYPDDIHSSTHEPGLTTVESSFGQQFWELWWRAGAQPNQQTDAVAWQLWRNTVEAAWAQLVRRFGASRALWIAGQLRPTNPANQPQTPIPPPATLPVPPVYPSPATRSRAWSRAARADCLPDRFVAIGIRGGNEIFRVWSGLVSNPLPLGPDPGEQSSNATAPADQAWYRWKTDFDAAVAAGMGIRVDPPLAPADGVIDQLFVLGVAGSSTADDSALRLQSLLEGHRYTWGLDLVPQGTPTNNTPGARSTYQRSDGPSAATLDLLFSGNPPATSDAARLAGALGVPGSLLASLSNADAQDHSDARAMNVVAWSAWWAYYCRRLLGDVFGGWSARETTLVRWRKHFLDFISARGPLPAIRTNNQPYGILPTSSLDTWTVAPSLTDLFVVQPGSPRAIATARVGLNLDASLQIESWNPPASLAALGNGSALRALRLFVAPDTGTNNLLALEGGHTAFEELTFRIGKDFDAAGTAHGDWTAAEKAPAPKGTETSFAACFGTLDSAPTDLWIASCRDESAQSVLALMIGRAVNADGRVIGGWQKGTDAPVPLSLRTRVLSMCTTSLIDPKHLDTVLLITGPAGVRPVQEVSILVGRDMTATATAGSGWSKPIPVTGAPAAPGNGVVWISKDAKITRITVVIADTATIGRSDQTALFVVAGTVDATRTATNIKWDAPITVVLPGAPPLAIASGAFGDGTKPSLSSEAGLVNVLKALRASWRQSLAAGAVATLGEAVPQDPDGVFLNLLSGDAVCQSVGARALLGPQAVSNLWRIMGASVTQATLGNYLNTLNGLQAPILTSLGMPGTTWIVRAAFADDLTELTNPTAQSEPASEADPLAENYLTWLTNRSTNSYRDPNEVHERRYFTDLSLAPESEPLLLKVARHALLNGYIDAALRQNPAAAGDQQRRAQLLGAPQGSSAGRIEAIDPEFIGLADVVSDDASAVQLPTRWDFLKVKEATTGLAMSEFLRVAGRDAELDEIRASLEQLAPRPSAVLDRLLRESLDLASYRLDAWITSLSTRRLQELRTARPSGIHLGAWGFVEHLAPATQAQSTGFVHAPSLGQATTAAVLRSGWLSHGGAQNANNPFSIDLSSARVRLAQELIEGVRQKQPLSALLGYQFERALHEQYSTLSLDRFVAPLRAKYPLVAGQLTATATAEPAESVAARNVLDGLKMLRDWSANQFDPATLTGITAPELTAVKAELTRLRDSLDCLNDLGTAEAVYQGIHGRNSRAGASLDSLSKGTSTPPVLEVANTPRTGVTVKHRVLVAIDPGAQGAQDSIRDWVAPTQEQAARQARKAAEPALDVWVSCVLGDPSRVRWRVQYDGGQSPTERNLLELGLSALDTLYATTADSPQAQSDLEALLILDAARNSPPGSSTDNIKILLDRNPKWDAGILSLPELLAVASAVRALVSEATAASNTHLSEVGNQDTGWDIPDFAQRATASLGALRTANQTLQTQKTAAGQANAPLDPLRNALLGLWSFGIPGSVPQSSHGDDSDANKALTGQADLVSGEADRRLAAADKLMTAIGQKATPTVDDYLSVFAEVFGRAFRALPRFRPLDPNTVTQAVTARQTAGDATPARTLEWFGSLSRVRERLSRFDRAMTLAECAGGGVQLGLEVAQLPLGNPPAVDRWIANTLAAGEQMPGGKVSMAIHHVNLPTPLDVGVALSGLVIDEWDELVPNANETTALAVHYDAPGCSAPNVILLAVPPILGRHWTVDSLLSVIRETVELAKLRGIDPDGVPGQWGHLLPTSVLAFNAGSAGAGDTVSTAFRL